MRDPSLTFVGGAGTVTGSKHLLDTGRSRVLVDCGLFQGLGALRRRNWDAPPISWRDLDAVVLTHAHLDHSGYLPVLARHGWRGPVYATEGTAELAAIVLADSAHLLEEEAAQANEGGWSKHRPALPLYDAQDAARACRLLRPVPSGQVVDARRRHAAHVRPGGPHPRLVLGASCRGDARGRAHVAQQRRHGPAGASGPVAAQSLDRTSTCC